MTQEISKLRTRNLLLEVIRTKLLFHIKKQREANKYEKIIEENDSLIPKSKDLKHTDVFYFKKNQKPSK